MTAAIEPKVDVNAGNAARPHLLFLDGLRGISALWVVFYHVAALLKLRYGDPPGLLAPLMGWMFYGDRAVSVFIVLSGYCLMMPVVNSPDRSLRGGFWGYMARRARRIFPPYYAALALSLAFYALWDIVKRKAHVGAGSWGEYAFDPQNIALHVLMLHDLSSRWIGALNPPMWSVAVEWHLYFFMPTLLLPLWRRAGAAVMLLAATIFGLLPHFLLGPSVNLDWAHPWLLILFAMGMAGAGMAPDVNNKANPVGKAPLLPIAILFAAMFMVVRATLPKEAWLEDILVGVAAVALILWLQRRNSGSPVSNNGLLRFLESRPARALGRYSYSLYLIHFLILWTIPTVARAMRLSYMGGLCLGLVFGVPVALATAYVFYLAAERPFTSAR